MRRTLLVVCGVVPRRCLRDMKGEARDIAEMRAVDSDTLAATGMSRVSTVNCPSECSVIVQCRRPLLGPMGTQLHSLTSSPPRVAECPVYRKSVLRVSGPPAGPPATQAQVQLLSLPTSPSKPFRDPRPFSLLALSRHESFARYIASHADEPMPAKGGRCWPPPTCSWTQGQLCYPASLYRTVRAGPVASFSIRVSIRLSSPRHLT